MHTGQLDQAIADFSKAMKIRPNFCWAHLGKGVLGEMTGRKKEAIEAYKNYIQLCPAYRCWQD